MIFIHFFRSDVFNEIFEQLGDTGAVVMNVDDIVEEFKVNLYQSISENFLDMWYCQEIELELNLLVFLKGKCKNNITAWYVRNDWTIFWIIFVSVLPWTIYTNRRPTGKTPEEQTKYLRLHYLKKKIAFVNTAIKAQELQLHVSIKVRVLLLGWNLKHYWRGLV